MRSVILGLGLVVSVAVGCADDAQDCDCAEVACFADMCTRTVFVIAEPVTAKFGGVTAADQLCAQQAAAAMLPGTYYAWLSDSAHSPYDRFSKSTVPYVLPDGTQVAADYEALASAQVGSIDVTAAGQKSTAADDVKVWTGSGIDGRADTFNNASNFCSDWSRSAIEDSVVIGSLRGRAKLDDWTHDKLVPCTGDGYLYCFQQ